MQRANRVHITPGADTALVDACHEFISAAAELDEFSETGQGDGAAILQRYYRALATLTRSMPQTPGGFTGRAMAAHLATQTVRRLVPREARTEIAAMLAEAAP